MKNQYTYLYYSEGEHALLNNDTKLIEFFVANKCFAGYAIPFRNTRLEFCRSYNENEMRRFIDGLKRIQHYGEQHPSFMHAHKVLAKLGYK